MSTLSDEDGLVKEIKVLHALRAHGATVKTSYHADHHEKNDYRIVAFQGRLRYHWLIQITRKLDDIGKLRKWLDSRRENNSINLYVQIETGVMPEKISSTILRQTPRLVPGSYVLYIPAHGAARVLSPEQRTYEIVEHLRQLREKCPTLRGAVSLVRDCEIQVQAENGQTYLSYDSDIKDSRLFDLILLMRRTRSGVSLPFVTFLATTEGRPTHRARDIVLDVPVGVVEPPPAAEAPTPQPKPVEHKRATLPLGVIGNIFLPTPESRGKHKGTIVSFGDKGITIETSDGKSYQARYADFVTKNGRCFATTLESHYSQGGKIGFFKSRVRRVWFKTVEEEGRPARAILVERV